MAIPKVQNILVIGAGGIGAFFASRLASLPGLQVSAVCRSNYQAVKNAGFRVTSPIFGETIFRPKYTFANVAEAVRTKHAENLRWDYCLVATKLLLEQGDPSELLHDLVDDTSSVVIFHNGLNVEHPYWERFPSSPIISAVTRTSVTQPSQGHVKHMHWTKTTLGPYIPNRDRTPKINATKSTARFATLLRDAGIPDVDELDHLGMQFARWHKVAINIAANPTVVLAGGLNNQALALDDDMCEHFSATMREVLDTACKVLQSPLPDSLPTIETVVQGVRDDVSGSKASMLHDWEDGRALEIEAILGNPLRAAKASNIEMPRTQTLYALIKSAQRMRHA